MSHAVDAAAAALLQAARTAAGHEAFNEPGSRIELARRLRAESERHERLAGLLDAITQVLQLDAEAAVDAARLEIASGDDEESEPA